MALFEETFAPYVPFGSRSLSPGSLGTDVAVVQAVYDLMLETMNPPQGPMGSPIGINGRFDGPTALAVKNIQAYFGLAVDGIVGPATFFAYGQGVGPFTTYGGPVYGGRQLSEGMSGGDVVVLHNRLNCFRYASITHGPASAFSVHTAQAVAALKRDAVSNGDTGFPSNGIAGFGFYDATWLYALAGGRSLSDGRNGFDVVFVQVVLLELGLYSGHVTGYYNAATVTAVKKFQEAMHIAVDGVVGPETFYQLGLANNVPAPVPLELAWPPAVIPKVTVCSVGLTTVSADLHPYGEASVVINQLEGFESLDVVGNFLPDPSAFGAEYTLYGFSLTDPISGRTVVTSPMFLTSQATEPEDWAGTYSPGVSTIPHGVVTVYAQTSRGVRGPAVLSANLQQCS